MYAHFSVVDGIVGEMSEIMNRSRDVDVLSEPNRFALISGLGIGEFVDSLLKKISHSPKYRGSFRHRFREPQGLSAFRGRDRRQNILRLGACDFRVDLKKKRTDR